MGRITRGLDLDLGDGQIGGKRAFAPQGFERRRNALLDVREHVHRA